MLQSYLLFLWILCILNGTLPFYHRPPLTAVLGQGLFQGLETKQLAIKAVNDAPKKLIGYWGQAKSRNLSPLPNYSEVELSTLCLTSSFDFIYLSFLRDFNTLDNLPGLEFSFHCRFPADAVLTKYKTMKSVTGFGPVRCPKIEAGIQVCQKLGKKVYLSLSPLVKFPSNIAIATASNFWNLFFGGKHELRPFGSAILDGIDFAVRTSDFEAYGPFLVELMRIATLNNFKLGVTVSPRCIFPDGFFGPIPSDRLLSPPNSSITDQNTLQYIDSVNVFFTSTLVCSYGRNQNFLSIINAWSDFTQKYNKTFFITLPGFGYGYENYFEAISGDFVTVSHWLDGSFLNALPSYWHGMALFDVSTDSWSLPCQNLNNTLGMNLTNVNLTSKSKYSDFVAYALSPSFQKNGFVCDETNYTTSFDQVAGVFSNNTQLTYTPDFPLSSFALPLQGPVTFSFLAFISFLLFIIIF
ncbi:hypothetical protein HMI54_006811 [Coelomomyces lativittatus]|nr:hypothetical protein HMI54_006811 [Coelomomyces lativittatus]KAJ1505064.1 hypothetical protein HMI56_001322 [Coelomomyces lativittatus]KAJ1506575.1 hypothetical protein HMI55_001124 [Coelomomyces lativittatus]